MHPVPDRHGRLPRTRRLIPSRRWPRRLLVAVNVIVAVCLVSVGASYGYVRYRVDAIRTAGASHLSNRDGRGSENILLIGNETRAGLTNAQEIAQFGSPQNYTGSLSDVIMILHLDPSRGTASILSIPRDLFLPMPAGSPVGAYQKVDAALNDGAKGPDNLIQTITDDLGIPINHYVELEFDGFQNTVNALGGINVDFPEPVFDANSLLNIPKTGCSHLNGTEALALVRSRHLQYDPPGDTSPQADWPADPESDLSRITRDHTFLRILVSTAKSQGLTNPLKLNAFLGAITDQITIDPGLRSQIISLAGHYRHLNPSAVPETTLPVTQVGGADGYSYDGAALGDVDFPVQPADNAVIAAWDGGALPKPVAPTGVQVLNGTGAANLAGTTASGLTADGLHVAGIGDANPQNATAETFVHYRPGDLAQALAVVHDLSGAVMLAPDGAVPAGQVTVDAGSAVAVVPPPAGRGATVTTTTAASATTTPTAGSTTTVPAPNGQSASSATDQMQPWDPRPCAS